MNDYRNIGKGPNVTLQRTVFDKKWHIGGIRAIVYVDAIVVAMKPIRKGKELLLDYGKDWWKLQKKFKEESE